MNLIFNEENESECFFFEIKHFFKAAEILHVDRFHFQLIVDDSIRLAGYSIICESQDAKSLRSSISSRLLGKPELPVDSRFVGKVVRIYSGLKFVS